MGQSLPTPHHTTPLPLKGADIMIILFDRKYNPEILLFFITSLEEYYSAFVNAVRNRSAKFYLPCFLRPALPDDYILYGTYKRKSIRDIQFVRQPDKTLKAVECCIEDFPVQRLLVMQDGHPHNTQALLPHLFIIYGTFTLRFVLYHLWQYLNSKATIEDYCLEYSISIPTFRKWLNWLEENISVLREEGLFLDENENRRTIKNWILEIRSSPLTWLSRSLKLLDLSLFQKHRMPENTVYRGFSWSG